MTISPPAELLGEQTPRLLLRPPDVALSYGVEAAELAASAGLHLDPWQRLVLDVGLGERYNRRLGRMTWAAFEVGLVVPRQNGKGAVLEARELAGLFLFGEQLILHSAHEFKTAAEAFRRVHTLIDNTDDLRRKVARVRTSHGDEGIELLSGARLRFVARSRGSGRGFSGDCVILDEAYALGSEAMGALLPTLSARPNPQVWYASSAPMASSVQLHAVRDRALAGGDESLAFCEWSVDADADPADPASWSRSNPALGGRIQPEFVAAERRAMPPAEFARERLGIPDIPASAQPSLIGRETWAELADPRSEWVGDPVGVVDVSPDGRASMVLAGRRADGLRHVELVDARAGVAWVESRRAELTERYGVRRWHRDPAGPAVSLPGEWSDLSARRMAEACAGFLRDVLEGHGFRWRCAEDLEPALDLARDNATQGVRGDGIWLWSRRRSGADISPIVAMTIGWATVDEPAADPMLAVW